MSEQKLKNIGGDPNDPHYRYKREVIQLVVSKKITTILNIDAIVRQLKMPAGFTTSFYKRLQKKFGMPMLKPGVFKCSNLTVKGCENVLEKMIKKYVLCPKCDNPEWRSQKHCPACGHGKTDDDVERVDIVDIVPEEKEEDDNTNKLYEIRDMLVAQGESTAEIDLVIDRLWNNEHVDINKILAKYTMGKCKLCQRTFTLATLAKYDGMDKRCRDITKMNQTSKYQTDVVDVTKLIYPCPDVEMADIS